MTEAMEFSTLCSAFAKHLSLNGLRRMPPIWREARMFRELSTLRRDPVFEGAGLPAGRGRPLFLIPGYMAGDASLVPMARAFKRAGWVPAHAGLRLNIGCASRMVAPLEAKLAAHVSATGQSAVIVGQSRGGSLGRLLAARRPDLVRALITLGSPHIDPLSVHPFVLANLACVGCLGTAGFPGLLSIACMRKAGCCAGVRREAGTKLSGEMPFLSIYSRSDGIVDYRACWDPDARHMEIDSSHCGMSMNANVLRAIGDELSSLCG